MPALHGQQIVTNGIILDTVSFGLLKISAAKAQGRWTVTIEQNGQQIAQRTFAANASFAEIETWGRTEIESRATNSESTLPQFYFTWRVIDRTPVTFEVDVRNGPIIE